MILFQKCSPISWNEILLYLCYLLFAKELVYLSGSKAEQKAEVLVLAEATTGYDNPRLMVQC